MVGGVIDWVAVVDQPSHDMAELAPVRVEGRDAIGAGVTRRGWRGARAVPRVQGDVVVVVVVVVGGQEDRVDPGFARVGGYASISLRAAL